MRGILLAVLAVLHAHQLPAQPDSTYLLRPERLFDGRASHRGWAVLVQSDRILAVGPGESLRPPASAQVLELPGMTLLPGLIEGHSHLLLHPYDETPWSDQVLIEPQALRVARATVHAQQTLLAGFTTARDLGTEGAGYADVGLQRAIAAGIIPGPRLLVATRALVATGSYGPKGFAPHVAVPLGAQAADGVDELLRAVREQIGHGAEWIKIYADYRWGPAGEARPSYSLAELTLAVEAAASSGRPVAAHATTAEGMRRAVLAGVRTIEHGDGGTAEVFRLMAERGVALCPTLAAREALARHGGWDPETDPEPAELTASRRSFQAALAAGVTLCCGSDAGVFRHGENRRELELMVAYGMTPLQALSAATTVNAEVLGLAERLGSIAPGRVADLIAVWGDPLADIRRLDDVRLVMKAGRLYLRPRP